jgi:2-(1,2-epoxy-1,2-dihydrophenyl)acetyl-CoA isomerase
MSLVLACDLAIAADTAFFTLAYVKIGTSPDGGATYFLPRTVGLKRAMEVALLGERLDAAAVERLGMINWVVPEADLTRETQALAGRLAAGPTQAIAHTKALLSASIGRDLEAQLQAEAISFAACSATEDMDEGVSAFVGKRQAVFVNG